MAREGSPRRGFAGAVGLVAVLTVLVTFLPSAGASAAAPSLSIRPTYYTQCYGTQGGTVFALSIGNYSGGLWSTNYAKGTLALRSQDARSPPNSSFETLGWISMGPGPSNNTCFNPNATSSTLKYTFSHLTFSVALKVFCATGATTSASAGYNLTLQGNIYDLTTGSFVWRSELGTTVGAKTLSCSSYGRASYTHLFAFHHGVNVRGSTTSLVSADSYWFIVDANLNTTTSASVGSSASATVSHVSMKLSHIDCPAC